MSSDTDSRPYAGKTVLITGASSGIGRSLANLFAHDGWKLVLVSQDQARLRAAASELKKDFQVEVVLVCQDLSIPGAARIIYDKVRKADIKVDALINNAGFATYGEFSLIDPDRETAEIQLNVAALTELTKLFVPPMLKRKYGLVLNVGSIAAFSPGPLMAVYYATKAYVVSFSEALAEELVGTGVTVSVVCPGPTATSFASTAKMSKSRLFKGTLMTADEVALEAYSGLLKGKRLIIPGVGNRIKVFGVRFVPLATAAKLVKRAQDR